MSRNSLVSYQQEASSLIAQFPKLPKASQKQVLDRVAHIIALAIVGEIGVRANTAMYQDEAAQALQMTGTYHMLSQLEPFLPPEMQDAFKQSFADAMNANRKTRKELEQHILSDIRSMQREPSSPSAEDDDTSSGLGRFLEDVAEGFTLGRYKAKK
ncbi:MAG: hypothetical protein ACR2IV_17505 [Bryobacteraceae bacterium]